MRAMVDKLAHAASSAAYEWTPLMLLFAYCLGSFALYPLLPDTAHEVLWFVLAGLQTLTSISVATEATQAIRPTVNARRDMRRAAKDGWDKEQVDWPRIDVILVAYLPNEKDIILRQMRYALTRIDYPPDRLQVYVVYNTPVAIEPVESEMRSLQDDYANVEVVKVHGSKSKADNINHFLSLGHPRGDIITIYDTDHYAEPSALRWVAKRFLAGDVDIVQGRCCVYNYSETLVTRLVGAEFDIIYGVMHAGRAQVQGYGFFGGSNGHWNASLLRTLRMEGHMLTEDIDSSLRAIVSGARIEYDTRVISYELAPTTVRSFNRQRLRWAQGWTQVALRHALPAVRRGAYTDANGWRSRIGLLQLLLYREAYFYINTQLFWILVGSLVTVLPQQGFHVFFRNFGGYQVAIWALGFNLVMLGVCLAITLRNQSHFVRWHGILALYALLPFYYVAVSHMAIFCHFRQFTGFSKWNPTKRT